MPKEQRRLFEETLRFAWEPELMRAGFEGIPWTYRRSRSEFAHFIGIEYDRRGSGLRLWLGATPTAFSAVPGDSVQSLQQVSLEICLFRSYVGG